MLTNDNAVHRTAYVWESEVQLAHALHIRSHTQPTCDIDMTLMVLFSQELLALPLHFSGSALDLTIIPNTGMIDGAETTPSCPSDTITTTSYTYVDQQQLTASGN